MRNLWPVCQQRGFYCHQFARYNNIIVIVFCRAIIQVKCACSPSWTSESAFCFLFASAEQSPGNVNYCRQYRVNQSGYCDKKSASTDIPVFIYNTVLILTLKRPRNCFVHPELGVVNPRCQQKTVLTFQSATKLWISDAALHKPQLGSFTTLVTKNEHKHQIYSMWGFFFKRVTGRSHQFSWEMSGLCTQTLPHFVQYLENQF